MQAGRGGGTGLFSAKVICLLRTFVKQVSARTKAAFPAHPRSPRTRALSAVVTLQCTELPGCSAHLMCSGSTIHLLDAWLAVFCPGALFLLKTSGGNFQGSSTCARDKMDFAFRQICGSQGAHLKPLLQSRTAKPALPDHTTKHSRFA